MTTTRLLLLPIATCLPGHPLSLFLAHPLTEGISLPILVWDSEYTHDLMALLPEVAVNFLAEQALPNHCDLHGRRDGSEGSADGIKTTVLNIVL